MRSTHASQFRPFVTIAAIVAATSLFAQSPAGARTAELQGLIKARVDARRNTGIVVGTIDMGGNSSMAAYGDAGPGTKPLDADSVFEIGSITKVFTATILADMVDRREVRLDEPVASLLPPGTKVPERNGRKITLLDLSTQTSGLPRMPDNLRPRDPSNPYADYTVAQMYDFLKRYELTRDVGAQYEYSNLGVGLLGHALALRAGRSYEVLVTERVLTPLHMDHTAITLTPWMTAHLARGHDTTHRVVPNWDLPTLAGAGALRSTMTDMLTFARANLGLMQDRPDPRLVRLMAGTHTVRQPTGRPDLSIGLNWHIRRVEGHDIVWHNGGTAGTGRGSASTRSGASRPSSSPTRDTAPTIWGSIW